MYVCVRIEPRASHIRDIWSTTELHLRPLILFEKDRIEKVERITQDHDILILFDLVIVYTSQNNL